MPEASPSSSIYRVLLHTLLFVTYVPKPQGFDVRIGASQGLASGNLLADIVPQDLLCIL